MVAHGTRCGEMVAHGTRCGEMVAHGARCGVSLPPPPISAEDTGADAHLMPKSKPSMIWQSEAIKAHQGRSHLMSKSGGGIGGRDDRGVGWAIMCLCGKGGGGEGEGLVELLRQVVRLGGGADGSGGREGGGGEGSGEAQGEAAEGGGGERG